MGASRSQVLLLACGIGSVDFLCAYDLVSGEPDLRFICGARLHGQHPSLFRRWVYLEDQPSRSQACIILAFACAEGRLSMRSVWIACFCLLAGCAHQEVSDRVQAVASLFDRHGFVQRDIITDQFNLRVWQHSVAGAGTMHVYIEGDGFAWVNRYQPSMNPTPMSSIVPAMAVKDDIAAQVIYLARPCQYVSFAERACSSAYWTQARFAPEVVAAMNQAVSQLKHEANAQKIVLIGYSGGGALAVLMAAQRQDVATVVTIAGNLDHHAWAKLHRLSELQGSLNPPDFSQALQRVRQVHLVGDQDSNMPVSVYQSYRAAFPQEANVTMEVISSFDHQCCWAERWPLLLHRYLN